ncbi:hypothetical protein NL676_017384 [Syzygium grande]|nr:hypothetical protein NL676_017384 [Syzygium grande]
MHSYEECKAHFAALGGGGAAVEDDQRGDWPGAMGAAGPRRRGRAFGGNGNALGVGEGGEGGGGGGVEASGGGDGGGERAGDGEEGTEFAATEAWVTLRGEVVFGHDGHAEALGEAAGGVGGVVHQNSTWWKGRTGKQSDRGLNRTKLEKPMGLKSSEPVGWRFWFV